MAVVNSILACKLYKSHKNPAKIIAAIQNPVNQELVQQLGEYLNEEDLAKLAAQQSGQSENAESAKTRIRESKGSAGLGGGGGASFADDDFFSDDDADEASDVDGIVIDEGADGEVIEGNPNSDDDDEYEVVQSQQLVGDTVTGATTLYNNDDGPATRLTLSSVVEVLKGTLNGRQDTAGVIRAVVKEDELWLHYNDSINLNTVMAPVLDFMNAAQYTYLKFNRLARTENAIVFEICAVDTEVRVDGSGDDDE